MDSTALSHMGRLAGVLLHMSPLDSDPTRLTVDEDIKVSVMTDRDIELRDLIVLG